MFSLRFKFWGFRLVFVDLYLALCGKCDVSDEKGLGISAQRVFEEESQL